MPLFDIHAYYGPEPMFGGLTSLEAVQAMMERFSLDAVSLISSRARYSDFIEGNNELRGILDAEKGVFGYATVNAAYPDESIHEMRIYLAKHNFLGTVLFPQFGTPVLLADVREIINAARRYTKPVLIYAEDREGVRAAREIATEFDQTKLILLNMGGPDWRAAVLAARNHPNMFLDFSGTLDADKIAHACATVSPRKILFGSGVPYADPNLYTGMMNEAASVSQMDKRKIAYQNALTVFNIEAEMD